MTQTEKICKELLEQLDESGVHYILSFQYPNSSRLVNAGKGYLQPALIATAIIDLAQRTKTPVAELAEQIKTMTVKLESVLNESKFEN